MGGLLRHEAYRGAQKGGQGPGIAGWLEIHHPEPATAARLELSP